MTIKSKLASTSIWSHRTNTVFIEYDKQRYTSRRNIPRELYREVMSVVQTLPDIDAISYLHQIKAELAPPTLTMKIWLPEDQLLGLRTESIDLAPRR